MEEMEYMLRAELRGHTEDVRALCVCDVGLLTGSRDKTIKLWKEGPDGAFSEACTLVGHTDFVSALAYMPPGLCAALPKGGVVSGSRDASVILWDLETAAPVQRLEGHQYQVSAVVVTPEGDVVSASLDKTIRVWRGGECVQTLEGHEAAVLCLLQLPNGDLLSGSGDCTIRVWRDGKCTHVINAHSDSVRGLALLPGVGVVSASHDQTLKVWTFDGECIAELVGHTGLVYCTAATADGTIASGSEDDTARLWHADGTCTQSLEHPGNLWGVAFLPDNDLVTACSDHVARVFTRKAEHTAPPEQLQAFAAAVASKKEAAAAKESGGSGGGGGGLPAGLRLEDPAVLLQPGTRDGQTKVVREGGVGVAYAWDATKGEWERIGEVVGGDDTMAAGSKMHNGQQWDYVFDVDIEDGAPPKRLALNRGQNPYDVADTFLAENELPASYREQIVAFIIQNTQGGVAAPSMPVNYDPYTGGSAYVPASSSGAANAASYGVTGGGADPFTGAASASVTSRHVPAAAYLVYDQTPARDAIRRKIEEFSGVIAAAAPESEAAAAVAPAAGVPRSEAELAEGGALDEMLSRLAGAAARSSGGEFSADDSGLLRRMLAWPSPQLFPALDLARLFVLHSAAAAQLAIGAGALAPDAPPGSLGRALANACAPPLLPANQQTAVRLACNTFASPALLGWAHAQRGALVDAFAPCASSANKNVRQGLASLLVNLAVMLSNMVGDELELKAHMLRLCVELLGSSPPEDAETRYRALVAVGTLLPQHSKVRSMACDLGMLSRAQALTGDPGKVGEAAGEVLRMLRL